MSGLRLDFNPDQPRAENGQFGEGGGSAKEKSSGKSVTLKVTKANPGAKEDAIHRAGRALFFAQQRDSFKEKAASAKTPAEKAKHEAAAAKAQKMVERHVKAAEKLAKTPDEKAHAKAARELLKGPSAAKAEKPAKEKTMPMAEAKVASGLQAAKAKEATESLPVSDKIQTATEMAEAAIQLSLQGKFKEATALSKQATEMFKSETAALKEKGKAEKSAAKEAKPGPGVAPVSPVSQVDETPVTVAIPMVTANFTPAQEEKKANAALRTINKSVKAWETGKNVALQNAAPPPPKEGFSLSEKEFRQTRDEFAKELDSGQLKACAFYSHEGDRVLNHLARTGRLENTKDDRLRDRFQKLDEVTRAYEMPKDTVVGRGISGPFARQFVDGLNPGDVYREPGYTSTSATAPFSGDVQLEITIPKGFTAGPIATRYANEDEFLLPRGSKFRVVSKEKITNSWGGVSHKVKVEVVR